MSAAPSPTVQERCDAFLDWLDETGFGSGLLLLAILVSVLWFWLSLLTPVHAAALAEPGPRESNLAGLLISIAPIVVAVVFMACATRGRPQQVDEEIFGDTTGFRERER